jgi:hypothetical protein
MDGVNELVENFELTSLHKENISILFQAIRAEVSEEQSDRFFKSLQYQLKRWIYESNSRVIVPTDTDIFEESAKIQRAAEELYAAINGAHFFTHKIIKTESWTAYGTIHEAVICDDFLEPLENLIISTKSIANEASQFKNTPGQKKYYYSHFLCELVLSSLERSKVNIKLGRKDTSPFTRLLDLVLEIKEVKEAFLAVTPMSHRDSGSESLNNGDSADIAIGVIRAHESYLKERRRIKE